MVAINCSDQVFQEKKYFFKIYTNGPEAMDTLVDACYCGICW